ncbi:MAG: hypothetical protein IKC11_04740 [Clostridia bacterium]|nr:hypothetical protein [Clostridia bacterium]
MATLSLEQYQRMVNGNTITLEKLNNKLKTQQEKLESETDSQKQQHLKNLIKTTETSIDFYERRKKALRPPTQEDIDYRMKVYNNFSNEVKSIIPKDCPICFHGTRYFNIENIIKSGGLSSSVDRTGHATSYDAEDQVSVTVVNTIETTIQGYTGLTDFEVPSGCVFLVLPKDEAEYKSSRTSMLIGNVDFRKEPERLAGIITSPENVEQIREWCKSTDINYNLNNICDFNEFLQRVKNKYKATEPESE